MEAGREAGAKAGKAAVPADDMTYEIARQLRNLHWISAESSAGIDANLAGALADRETLLSLRLEEAGRSGGRFRQRLLWRNIRRGTRRNPESPILTG